MLHSFEIFLIILIQIIAREFIISFIVEIACKQTKIISRNVGIEIINFSAGEIESALLTKLILRIVAVLSDIFFY